MSETKTTKTHNVKQLQQNLHGMALSALLCTSALVAVNPAYAADKRINESTVAAVYAAKIPAVLPRQMDSDSLYNLALKYIDGDGLPRNEQYGLSLLKQSAKRGHTEAQYTLGVILAQEGEEYVALNWLAKAANKGHEEAQFVHNQIMNSDFGIGC